MLKRGRKPTVWTPEMDALFGTMNDQMIGVQLGLSSATVRNRRLELGLSKSPVRRPQEPRIRWTPEMDALLGTDFDAVVAEKLGIHRNYVFNRRNEMGIPPTSKERDKWNTPEFVEQLGQRTDAEIAREMGFSREAVRQARVKHGVQKYERGEPDWASVAERLGKVSDAVIAKELDVALGVVQLYRRAHRIPMIANTIEYRLDSRSDIPSNWREILGTIPDNHLRKMWKMNLSSLVRVRNVLGIPPYKERAPRVVDWSDPALVNRLGKETDAQIAKSLGVATATISSKRNRMGIPPFRPKPYRQRKPKTKGENT